MKDIHKQHEDVLKAQMEDKEAKKNRKKMNTLELLYNKALMKAAAEEGHQPVKKTNTRNIPNWNAVWFVTENQYIKDRF